jgi:hypothetical protein
VKSTNLRNKPIDRRRLSKQDREQYQPKNRMTAVAKARARKGQLAWKENTKQGRQEHNPGTGGFVQGISLQQARLREEGAKVKRAEALRPQSL